MISHRIRRRSVLGLLAVLAARPTLALARDEDPLLRICLRAAGQPDLVRLGFVYCRERPATTRAGWLAELRRHVHGTDVAEVAESLRRTAVSDFRAGRIVSLDGWCLSVTEARVMAAAATTVGAQVG